MSYLKLVILCGELPTKPWLRWKTCLFPNRLPHRSVRFVIGMHNLMNICSYYARGLSQSSLVEFLIIKLIEMRSLHGLIGSTPLPLKGLGLRRSMIFCFLILLLLVGIFGKLDVNFVSSLSHQPYKSSSCHIYFSFGVFGS